VCAAFNHLANQLCQGLLRCQIINQYSARNILIGQSIEKLVLYRLRSLHCIHSRRRGDRVDSRQLIADTVLVLEVERGTGALQLAFRYHGLAV